MADASLDDFFAKKDKSKKKSKSKQVPSLAPDIIIGSGTQEDTSKKKKKKKPEKENTEDTHSIENTTRKKVIEGEDDWNDFEQQAEIDYSGLKIQTLQIIYVEAWKRDDYSTLVKKTGNFTNKEEDDQEENRSEEEEGEDGEKKEKRDVLSGPWNKQQANVQAPVSKPVVEQPPPPPPEDNQPKPVAKYIPPSLRGGSSTPSTVSSSRKAKKTAPNLTSEEDFPTLGGMREGQYGDDSQRGQVQDPRHKKIELTLENKFSALQD